MATVEKMPMLQEGYEKLTADLRRLKDERPQIVDAIPPGLTYNDACTKQTLPAGSTTSYNPVTRELVITLPDITVAQTDYDETERARFAAASAGARAALPGRWEARP